MCGPETVITDLVRMLACNPKAIPGDRRHGSFVTPPMIFPKNSMHRPRKESP